MHGFSLKHVGLVAAKGLMNPEGRTQKAELQAAAGKALE